MNARNRLLDTALGGENILQPFGKGFLNISNPISYQKKAVAPSICGKPVLQSRRQLLALEWPQEHLQVVAS